MDVIADRDRLLKGLGMGQDIVGVPEPSATILMGATVASDTALSCSLKPCPAIIRVMRQPSMLLLLVGTPAQAG